MIDEQFAAAPGERTQIRADRRQGPLGRLVRRRPYRARGRRFASPNWVAEDDVFVLIDGAVSGGPGGGASPARFRLRTLEISSRRLAVFTGLMITLAVCTCAGQAPVASAPLHRRVSGSNWHRVGSSMRPSFTPSTHRTRRAPPVNRRILARRDERSPGLDIVCAIEIRQASRSVLDSPPHPR